MHFSVPLSSGLSRLLEALPSPRELAHRARRLLFVLCALSAGAGCIELRLISDYDEATDKGLTEIQELTDDFI